MCSRLCVAYHKSTWKCSSKLLTMLCKCVSQIAGFLSLTCLHLASSDVASVLCACVCIANARDCVHCAECYSIVSCHPRLHHSMLCNPESQVVTVAGHCASPSQHGKRQYSSASRRMTRSQRLPHISRMPAWSQHGTHGGSPLLKAMLTMTSLAELLATSSMLRWHQHGKLGLTDWMFSARGKPRWRRLWRTSSMAHLPQLLLLGMILPTTISCGARSLQRPSATFSTARQQRRSTHGTLRLPSSKTTARSCSGQCISFSKGHWLQRGMAGRTLWSGSSRTATECCRACKASCIRNWLPAGMLGNTSLHISKESIRCASILRQSCLPLPPDWMVLLLVMHIFMLCTHTC